jgi:hypothetical protein
LIPRPLESRSKMNPNEEHPDRGSLLSKFRIDAPDRHRVSPALVGPLDDAREPVIVTCSLRHVNDCHRAPDVSRFLFGFSR